MNDTASSDSLSKVRILGLFPLSFLTYYKPVLFHFHLETVHFSQDCDAFNGHQHQKSSSIICMHVHL